MPISPLELNTFGHAVLALLIYILWWEKPFDVEHPSIVESGLLSKRRALDLMRVPSYAVLQAAELIKIRLEGAEEFQADIEESQPFFKNSPRSLKTSQLPQALSSNHVPPTYALPVGCPYKRLELSHKAYSGVFRYVTL